jgi:hypothetical protein
LPAIQNHRSFFCIQMLIELFYFMKMLIEFMWLDTIYTLMNVSPIRDITSILHRKL